MAFGGYFNPNYTLLPQQQGGSNSPQLPPMPSAPQVPYMPQPRQSVFEDMGFGPQMFGFSNFFGLSPTPMRQVTKPGATTVVPNATQTPPSSGSRPVSGAPTQPQGDVTSGTPVSKPGGTTTPPASTTYIPNTGVYGQPGQYAAPNPGGDPRYAVPTPPPAQSGQQAYDQELAYYNSPEYSAYYNSLAPSTRAYMHAPGNSATGTYLANSARQNWEAWQGNPWTRPPGG